MSLQQLRDKILTWMMIIAMMSFCLQSKHELSIEIMTKMMMISR